MSKIEFKTICVFGDSISWGKGDTEQGGWVNRLKNSLYTINPGLEVIDVSVPGDTSRDLLKRFRSEAEAREPQIIALAIGVNDSLYLGHPDKRLIPLEEYERNIRELIKQASEVTDKVFVVGLSPVDESKTKPIYQVTRAYYTNADISRYNQKLREVVEAENVKHIEVYGLINPEDLPDGLHISASGHKKIADKVQEFLLSEYVFLLENPLIFKK